MNELTKRAWRGNARVMIIMAVLLFLTASTINYVQGWIFLGVFAMSMATITWYLAAHDPQLLERRMKAGPGAETQKAQKIIHLLLSVTILSALLLSGLDHRFGWSQVPPSISALGNLLVVAGFALIFLTFKANSFAAAVVETSAAHRVISTGLYGYVRHPMYTGLLIILPGASLALGSGIGLLTLIPALPIIMWRLLDEEAFLVKNLPGYADYRQKVTYRLLPFVW